MTLSYDSCRLYLHLRNKACTDSNGGAEPQLGTCRVISLCDDDSELEDIGLTPGQADDALDSLLKTSLLQRVSDEQEHTWEQSHPGPHGKLLLVAMCDDLTAATVVFGQ